MPTTLQESGHLHHGAPFSTRAVPAVRRAYTLARCCTMLGYVSTRRPEQRSSTLVGCHSQKARLLSVGTCFVPKPLQGLVTPQPSLGSPLSTPLMRPPAVKGVRRGSQPRAGTPRYRQASSPSRIWNRGSESNLRRMGNLTPFQENDHPAVSLLQSTIKCFILHSPTICGNLGVI